MLHGTRAEQGLVLRDQPAYEVDFPIILTAPDPGCILFSHFYPLVGLLPQPSCLSPHLPSLRSRLGSSWLYPLACGHRRNDLTLVFGRKTSEMTTMLSFGRLYKATVSSTCVHIPKCGHIFKLKCVRFSKQELYFPPVAVSNISEMLNGKSNLPLFFLFSLTLKIYVYICTHYPYRHIF